MNLFKKKLKIGLEPIRRDGDNLSKTNADGEEIE